MLTYFSAMLVYARVRLGELHAREPGVTAVEYALMVAIIALLLVGGFYVLYAMIKDRYAVVGNCVADGPTDPQNCTAPTAPG